MDPFKNGKSGSRRGSKAHRMDLGRIRGWERRMDEQSSGCDTEQSLPAQSGQWWLGKATLGCPVVGCPSSLPWGEKSSPQSSEMKVLSVCVKCWLMPWLCRAPREQKVMEQYKQQKGWEPMGEAVFESGLGQPG